MALSQEYPPLNSAFITFNQQIAAHMAKNALNHHDPYRMTGRYAEVAPEDVIWGNLGMNAYEAKVRMLVSYAATAGLIILWAFPGQLPILPSCVRHTHRFQLHSCLRRYHLQYPRTLPTIQLARLALQAPSRRCWYHSGYLAPRIVGGLDDAFAHYSEVCESSFRSYPALIMNMGL